jgi:hypothetical protein
LESLLLFAIAGIALDLAMESSLIKPSQIWLSYYSLAVATGCVLVRRVVPAPPMELLFFTREWSLDQS